MNCRFEQREVGTRKSYINVDHLDQKRWGPPLVGEDWGELNDAYKEMSRAVVVKKPAGEVAAGVTKNSSWQRFTERHGTEELLVQLALGRIREPRFDGEATRELQNAVIAELESRGLLLERIAGDRKDVPADFRYLDLLLRAAGSTEIGMGRYAQGVCVGPGVRMPRLPAIFKQKRRWRVPEQTDPLDYLEQPQDDGITWRRNNASLDQWKEQVLKVLHDQASRECRRVKHRRNSRTLTWCPWGRSARTNPTARSARGYSSTERTDCL